MKKTSEISKLAGVSKRAVQFYDNEGMIHAERSENNYRLYDEKALQNLWEIMVYKEMGLELREIKEILRMSDEEKKNFFMGYAKCTEEKIQELEERKRFISLVMTRGLPEKPAENSGITFKNKINKLRKGCEDE